MKIAINTQLLIPGKLDGIGWYTYETLSRITARHPEHEFILIFDRKPSPELKFPSNTRFVVLSPPSRHPILWFMRFEIILPFLLRKLKPDVFVTPDGWMTMNSPVPCVQVIHDLNFVHFPEDIPFFTRKYYNILFKRYARKARRIATVSNYSKQDIIKAWGISPDKVDVTHNGCNEAYKPLSPEEKEMTLKKYSGGFPYFLYVGALIPRKNIARMFEAFNRFKKQDKQNTRLLVVGQKKWWTPAISEAWEKLEYKEEVIFLGRLDVAELNQLYAASVALLFVPYFEGFGIPILEAFNSGSAVITSNVTSMPEVAGDAALLADPYSIDSISEAMISISTNEDLRNSLIEKGKERSRQFSWDKTADALWKIIEKAAKNT
ncbi:MAG: glycosyltransferase family 4 protein [Bacteroidales bacterium]|nr:glycosyltransferase family 4 protein [Bacteroidales bacterium]